MRQTLFLALTLLCLLSACQQTKSDSEQTSRSGAFSSHSADTSAVSRIVASGELIVTTLSGPDTYYDYQGQEFGVQFALAQRFAASLGVGIRVEVASDTLTLVNHVLNGDADLIALKIRRCMHSSAYALKGTPCEGLYSRIAERRPSIPSCVRSSLSPPARKYGLAQIRTS